MSQAFAARYSLTYVEDKGSGVWECTGKIYDDGATGYLAPDVIVGDVIIDESPFFGTTNRWRITQIISAAVRDLVCRVVWDDEGTEDLNGPAAGDAAICSVSSNVSIAEIPTQAFAKISETLQTRLQNIDSRKNIDNISGGSSTYTNASPTPSTLGGIVAGSTFTAQTMQQMWDALLYPYQAPAFTSFVMSGQATTLEVGDSTAVDPTFTWGTSNSGNVSPNTLRITDVTGGGTLLADNLANDGSEAVTLAAITKTSAASHVFRIRGTNTNTDFFTRDFTVNWLWRRFYGEDTDAGPLAEADIEALRVSGLASGFAGTYSFVGGGYKYLAYPIAFGTATTFKDSSTNLDIPFETPYIVSVTNGFGQATDYRVHRSTNIMGAAISIIVS